jgi:hypothetical protein
VFAAVNEDLNFWLRELDSRQAGPLFFVAMASEKRPEASNIAWCITSLGVLLISGGFVFSRLERGAELEHYQRNKFFYQQMRELYEMKACKRDWMKDMEFCRKQEEFHGLLKQFFERSGNEMEDRKMWTFTGSVFFVITLVTTLGYGNFHPRTPQGQLFTVLFGIVGLPVMCYILSHFGRLIVDVWMPLCSSMNSREVRIAVLCVVLVAFILIGGALFEALESWSFLESCYFSAMTLMSIGFGDFLPSSFYSRLAASIFILLGLGVASSFIALLQVHVQLRGEVFAKQLTSWYNTVTTECGGGNEEDDDFMTQSNRNARIAG